MNRREVGKTLLAGLLALGAAGRGQTPAPAPVRIAEPGQLPEVWADLEFRFAGQPCLLVRVPPPSQPSPRVLEAQGVFLTAFSRVCPTRAVRCPCRISSASSSAAVMAAASRPMASGSRGLPPPTCWRSASSCARGRSGRWGGWTLSVRACSVNQQPSSPAWPQTPVTGEERRVSGQGLFAGPGGWPQSNQPPEPPVGCRQALQMLQSFVKVAPATPGVVPGFMQRSGQQDNPMSQLPIRARKLLPERLQGLVHLPEPSLMPKLERLGVFGPIQQIDSLHYKKCIGFPCSRPAVLECGA